MFIRLCHIRARIARLLQLEKGLMREPGVWKERQNPLHKEERRAYLDALGQADLALRQARFALEKAVRRLEEIRGPTWPPL